MLETIGAIAKPLIKSAPGEAKKTLGKVLILRVIINRRLTSHGAGTAPVAARAE